MHLASISEAYFDFDTREVDPMSEHKVSETEPTVPDFAVIECTIEISLAADKAWEKIGIYGDAGKYLNVESQQIAGKGGIGSVRTISGSIVEVMVGKGPLSYTYTQTTGPMADFQYHGNVALDATGENSSKLTYTINYDQTKMDQPARAAAAERIRPRFQGMVEAMKADAEASAS